MDFNHPIVQMLDRMLYFSFLARGMFHTAYVFRQETGFDYFPLSPTGPLDDFPVENANGLLMRTNSLGQMEWTVLFRDDDTSSYSEENNMGQQSGLTPSGEHELNEQTVEGLTLDEIFGGTDNQGLASVDEAYQSSKLASNECCIKAEEDDAWDFFITDDILEPLSIVNGKKNEERGSCSKYAYLYDSSAFDLGNEVDGVVSAFTFDEYPETPNHDEIQGVTVGGNLVLRTMQQPEILALPSNQSNIEDTDTPGPHPVAKTVLKTTEIASNKAILCGRKRKWAEAFGDAEGDDSTRNAHLYESSCGKGYEDGDVSLHNELQGLIN